MAAAPNKLGRRRLQRPPLPFLKGPGATGWGREEKHNRVMGGMGEGSVSNEAKVTRSVIWEGNS